MFPLICQSNWGNTLQQRWACSWVFLFHIVVNCSLTLAKHGFLLCPMRFKYLDTDSSILNKKYIYTKRYLFGDIPYLCLPTHLLNHSISIYSTVLHLHETSPKIGWHLLPHNACLDKRDTYLFDGFSIAKGSSLQCVYLCEAKEIFYGTGFSKLASAIPSG